MTREEKYATCPNCGYKETITVDGREGFQKASRNVVFPCMQCGAPLAPHEDKSAFDADPGPGSQKLPKLQVRKGKVPTLGELEEVALARIMNSTNGDPIRIAVRTTVEMLEKSGILVEGEIEK